jgi:hypothetical protein
MAFETRYDREQKILHLSLKGAPTVEQFEEAMQVITTSDLYPPDVDTLWDFRDADLNGLNRDVLMRFIDVRNQHPTRAAARLACVVTGDFAFGMMRMFELQAEASVPHRMLVCKSHAEAEQWLLDRKY